jgi:hypothetical protein
MLETDPITSYKVESPYILICPRWEGDENVDLLWSGGVRSVKLQKETVLYCENGTITAEMGTRGLLLRLSIED